MPSSSATRQKHLAMMTDHNRTPEQRARTTIDTKLEQAGWSVQALRSRMLLYAELECPVTLGYTEMDGWAIGD